MLSMKGVFMDNYQIDLSKYKEEKKGITEVICSTMHHPTLARIYNKNSIANYLGEFCMMLDRPSFERVERVKLSSSLIYWDILFVLIDNSLEIFADDIDMVNEMSKSDIREMSNVDKNIFLLNFAAANFYSFSHIKAEREESQTVMMLSIVE